MPNYDMSVIRRDLLVFYNGVLLERGEYMQVNNKVKFMSEPDAGTELMFRLDDSVIRHVCNGTARTFELPMDLSTQKFHAFTQQLWNHRAHPGVMDQIERLQVFLTLLDETGVNQS